MTTKMILSGCNGKMGQAISNLVLAAKGVEIVAGFDLNAKQLFSYPVYDNFNQIDIAADVLVDFSRPEALPRILEFATARKIPVVLATTGLSAEQLEAVRLASSTIAVMASGNMSLGVNLLLDIVKRAARILSSDYDVEIIEKHHNQKIDAPSGTALMLANAVNEGLDEKLDLTYERASRKEKRSKKELGIHSLRGGTIVGEHSVLFEGYFESIEIKHTAHSREIFASGALRAAQFMAGRKPGMYSMMDVIGGE